MSIKLESIEQDFPIVEEYEFNVPDIRTSCYCTCQSLNSGIGDYKCKYGRFGETTENTTNVKISFDKTLNHGICKGNYTILITIYG